MKIITQKIKNFVILTRSHQYQHIILFGTLPLFLGEFTISAFVFYYLLFFLLTAFGFMINDYYDQEMDKLSGKKTSLTLNIISKDKLLLLAYSFLSTSMLIAYFLSSSTIWIFGIIAFLVWSYSAPPFRFKTSSWLEFPVVILGYGPLNFVYTATTIGYSNTSVIFLYFIFTFLVIGQSQLNNCLKDFEGDKKSKSKNLAQKLGFKKAFLLRKIIRLLIPVILIIIYFVLSQKNILMVLTALIFTVDTLCDSTKDFSKQRDASYTIISTIALLVLTVSQLFK
jgi:4-hydroxybenzoate polyprenyltransferase